LAETDDVCNYIRHGGDKQKFLEQFKGAYSPGFDPDEHLQAVGVANQTTMLRGETEEVQRRIKAAVAARFGVSEVDKHFRFFDTICGATQDRQDALQELLREPMDLLLVIGGYNSSNTSHLSEMGEAKLPTYFIKNAAMMVSDKLIRHYSLPDQKEVETRNWLTEGKITVGITAGASCPNNLIEDAIRRLFELRGISVHELLSN
jgi:4-hydroxy-3-methylbut-2-enyl diphosphate reductase